jgi:hypothetical protein
LAKAAVARKKRRKMARHTFFIKTSFLMNI